MRDLTLPLKCIPIGKYIAYQNPSMIVKGCFVYDKASHKVGVCQAIENELYTFLAYDDNQITLFLGVIWDAIHLNFIQGPFNLN